MDLKEFTREQHSKMSLSDFRLSKIIGKGAFGKIWLAEYLKTGKLYALKIIKKDFAPKDIDVSTSLSLILDHPNLMKVYGYFFERLIPSHSFSSKSHIILVLEYIIGTNLYTKIRRGDIINLDLYIPQILDGLEYLHNNKIIHRDLKPENILITEKDKLKIIDYDFLIQDFYPTDKVGTPYYAAPDVYNKTSYNCSVDLWSLGISLWCCITGKEPYDAPNKNKLYEKILKEEPDWRDVKDSYYYPILKGLIVKNSEKRWNINRIRTFLRTGK